MMTRIDMSSVVRLVDNWRERCPGTVDKKNLIQLGIQKERRLLKRMFGKKIKNIIYQREGTQEIWYKRKECAVGVVAMGFSTKLLESHPNAVPMAFYWDVFTMPNSIIPISLLSEQQADALEITALTGHDWLKMNDYELI